MLRLLKKTNRPGPFSFGFSSSPLFYEQFRGFQNHAMAELSIPGVTIVRNEESAEKALRVLHQFPKRVHAWDTETIDIDVKTQSPVLEGRIISAQCFLGPDADFGNGPRLMIDNFGECADLIEKFKDYFENESIKKCWHNYGFDRHVFYHHGINVK